MSCPRCRSNNIDSSGTCLACGCAVSPLAKELAQKLEAMRLKEEEIDQNLQNIIDMTVSRQAAPLPPSGYDGTSSVTAMEGLIFRKVDDNEPTADLFVAVDDDTPDVSAAPDASHIADFEYAVDTEGTDAAGYAIDYKDIANIDVAAAAEDYTDAGYTVDYKDIANIDVAAAAEDYTDTEEAEDYEDAAEDYTDTEETEDYEDAAEDYTDTEEAEDYEDAAVADDSPYAANAFIPENPEGRLIFLSRTLSGLVDLFLIALFSVIFLCLADYFTNAPILSSINTISFAALFLMIYLLYSIFFLGTNNQTIGMMATDLRVVGMNQEWISMSQVVRRCAAFLVSLFGLGIGLLIGILSRECLCLHDRLSETCIVRSNPTYDGDS